MPVLLKYHWPQPSDLTMQALQTTQCYSRGYLSIYLGTERERERDRERERERPRERDRDREDLHCALRGLTAPACT